MKKQNILKSAGFIFKTIVVMVIILINNQMATSDITPNYSDCHNYYEETNLRCEPESTWTYKKEILEYYPGCFIEVDYIIKKCDFPSNQPHYKVEILGFRIIDYPGCNTLYNYVINPNGTVNEAYARIVQRNIHKMLADKYMKELVDNMSLMQKLTWSCGQIPPTNRRFFEIYEGTCMGLCRTRTTIQYGESPFGLLGPGPGTYVSEYFSYVKCNNYCCNVIIDYCYDHSQNAWKRIYNSGPYYTDEITCDPNPVPIMPCYSPPIFNTGNIILITSIQEILECTETCEQITDPVYLNW
jgi:hypothetical protein